MFCVRVGGCGWMGGGPPSVRQLSLILRIKWKPSMETHGTPFRLDSGLGLRAKRTYRLVW